MGQPKLQDRAPGIGIRGVQTIGLSAADDVTAFHRDAETSWGDARPLLEPCDAVFAQKERLYNNATSLPNFGFYRPAPARTCRSIALGASGYTKDWPDGRLVRDAKLLDFGAGTNEIRRMLMRRELPSE